MQWLWSIIGIAAGVAVLFLLITYICFRMAFYVPHRSPEKRKSVSLPGDDIYAPYRERMERWAEEALTMPHEAVTVTSFDGLTLCGRFYEYAPGAPVELMFHGYRGDALKDLAGGIYRCFKMGRSVLLVDQRCCGNSEGKVITFGLREYRDCLTWLDFILDRLGPEAKIILTGVSMGASTVLLAGGTPLPKQVIGILADCGYDSAATIIKTVIRQMGLPADGIYPFVRWGARLYGGFDPDAESPVEAVKHCSVPVIFFHGEADDFVPCAMSRVNFEACASRKRLVTVPGAGHGLSYPVEPERYLQELRDFFGTEASFPVTEN